MGPAAGAELGRARAFPQAALPYSMWSVALPALLECMSRWAPRGAEFWKCWIWPWLLGGGVGHGVGPHGSHSASHGAAIVGARLPIASGSALDRGLGSAGPHSQG